MSFSLASLGLYGHAACVTNYSSNVSLYFWGNLDGFLCSNVLRVAIWHNFYSCITAFLFADYSRISLHNEKSNQSLIRTGKCSYKFFLVCWNYRWTEVTKSTTNSNYFGQGWNWVILPTCNKINWLNSLPNYELFSHKANCSFHMDTGTSKLSGAVNL